MLVEGDITIAARPATQVALKNFAPLIKLITKVDEATIDDTEDLDLVMPMDNLIQFSSNYSDTTESLWICSKDKASNFNADIAINNNNFKYLEYTVKLLGNTVAQPNPNHADGILKMQQLLYH